MSDAVIFRWCALCSLLLLTQIYIYTSSPYLSRDISVILQSTDKNVAVADLATMDPALVREEQMKG